MRTTITIRADETLRDALNERARARGKTTSELVREILLEAITDRPIGTRAGHLKGRLKLAHEKSEGWRDRLRQRNWRD